MKLLPMLFLVIGGVAAIGLYGLDELPAIRLAVMLVSVVGVGSSIFLMNVGQTQHDDWLRVLSEYAERESLRSRHPFPHDVLANSSICP